MQANLPAGYGKDEAYYSSSEYRQNVASGNIISRSAYEREQRIKQDLQDSYSDTGGLPKNLRYPYARIEDGMDFLKIQIASYTPPDLNLEALINVGDSKDNPTGDLHIGVVAQELETVSPKLVTEVATSSDDLTSTETVKSVKYSVLYMKAIKALQEAQTRIETLETKVAALEAA